MNIPLLDKRVGSLEEMMADLIATVSQTSVEMRAFKDEMEEDRRNSKEETAKERRNSEKERRKFKEEMQEDRRSFKEEMREFKDSMESFKDGMETFKDRVDRYVEEGIRDRAAREIEMRDFKAEMKNARLELNKELGDIANRQGRMVEDLVAPSICRILRQVMQIPPKYACAVVARYKRIYPKNKAKMKEFDVIAECGDYVMINETKSTLQPSNIPKLKATIQAFREYFPEHKDKKIIGSLATLYADKSLIKYASRHGILVLAVGIELMDVMNEPGFKPAEF